MADDEYQSLSSSQDSTVQHHSSPSNTPPLVVVDPPPCVIVHQQGGFHLETFRTHLLCPSCKDLLTEPKTLSCLDSFCAGCLLREQEEQRHERERELREAEDQERRNLERQVEDGEPLDDRDDESIEIGYGDEEINESLHSPLTIGSRSSIVDPDSFLCPLPGCNTGTGIPLHDQQGLKNLPRNHSLVNMRRTLELKEKLPRGEVVCGACEDAAAIAVCNNKECGNRPFCGECLKGHLRDKQNKEHLVVYPNPPDPDPNGGGSAGQTLDWKRFRQCEWYCHIHNCLMDVYCEDHDEVICIKCGVFENYHGRCRKNGTPDIHNGFLEEMERKLDAVKQLHEEFEAAIITSNAVKRALIVKRDTVNELITDRCDSLIQQLQTQRDDLIRRTNRICDLKTRELNEHLAMLNRISGNITRSLIFTERFARTAIPSEFMFLKTQINNRLDDLVNQFRNYNLLPADDDIIYLEKNNSFDLTGAIGRVYSTPCIKKFHIHPRPTRLRAQNPHFFTVTSRDILGTELMQHERLPRLFVTLRPLVDGANPIMGVVDGNHSTGRYAIGVFPHTTGRHELCIYHDFHCPHHNQFNCDCNNTLYNRHLVGGRKFNVEVIDSGLVLFNVP